MKTLVLNGHHELNGVTYHHGSEMPPDLLSGELRDWWLDHGWVREHDSSERRSLHRLFSHFSGSSESEPIDSELKQFAL
jgi:hypothetical protein